MNKTDLQVREGPTVTRPVQEPLAITHLENQLYMHVIDIESSGSQVKNMLPRCFKWSIKK